MAKAVRKPKSNAAARAKAKAKPSAPRSRVNASVAVDMSKLEVAWPRHKQPVNLRIDSDIIDWFREGGSGYQTRMNAVLRAFVDAQSKRR
ncbi:MAG TPA: BrnA antitoxin family protein [Acetobacteraceae bacterium]|jgi:uncharacterized protein (DUF4415 family)|nr:BrnA antitoxin family protein [Acetobacteraceae bacterium]